MNVIAVELAKRFEEIPPMEFYREVFPDGELDEADEMTPGRYTGIAVEITNEKKNGKQVIRRYTVTDDLDMIDYLQYSKNFCILAPISYAGKSRVSRNARFMYALVVELDNLIVNEKHSTIATANQFDIPLKTLEKWITAYNKDHNVFDEDYLSKEQQIIELKKRNSKLEKDNEILKKTITLLAKKE